MCLVRQTVPNHFSNTMSCRRLRLSGFARKAPEIRSNVLVARISRDLSLDRSIGTSGIFRRVPLAEEERRTIASYVLP